MSYVYIKTEPQLWTVGFYDPKGEWHSESDYPNPDQAASRVAWLNGGKQELSDNHPYTILNSYGAQQGWLDSTMLSIACDFIHQSSPVEKFRSYVAGRADEDNAEAYEEDK
jgi:hypothetical protein